MRACELQSADVARQTPRRGPPPTAGPKTRSRPARDRCAAHRAAPVCATQNSLPNGTGKIVNQRTTTYCFSHSDVMNVECCIATHMRLPHCLSARDIQKRTAPSGHPKCENWAVKIKRVT
eukprot:256504-Pyramimonas_sp.AAC.1